MKNKFQKDNFWKNFDSNFIVNWLFVDFIDFHRGMIIYTEVLNRWLFFVQRLKPRRWKRWRCIMWWKRGSNHRNIAIRLDRTQILFRVQNKASWLWKLHNYNKTCYITFWQKCNLFSLFVGNSSNTWCNIEKSPCSNTVRAKSMIIIRFLKITPQFENNIPWHNFLDGANISRTRTPILQILVYHSDLLPSLEINKSTNNSSKLHLTKIVYKTPWQFGGGASLPPFPKKLIINFVHFSRLSRRISS